MPLFGREAVRKIATLRSREGKARIQVQRRSVWDEP